MNVWLLGAEGILGSAFLRLFEREKITCIATGHTVDITDRKALDAIAEKHQPTHIVNCAAYTDVDRAENEEPLALEANGTGPQHLGEIANALSLPLLHFSTDYVFDGTATKPYKETDPPAPINAYGRTKLEGERRLLEAYPEATIVRSSWLFGSNGRNFVNTMLEKMKTEEEIAVVADQHGRPTYAEDLAQLAWQLIGQAGVFHLANGGATTWQAFAEAILDCGKGLKMPLKTERITPIPSTARQGPAKRPAYSVLDTGKAERLLDCKIRSHLEALEDYLTVIL